MTRRWFLGTLLLIACLGSSCPQNGLPNGGDQTEVLQPTVYATNTNGASGLAIRPSDGALFAVNADGLFGPIEQGDDLSTLTPIGATNLDAIFGATTTSLALAITNDGEFWIGSFCCSRLAVVPPGGGDAVGFDGLIATNINPRALALVPAGFSGTNVDPGNLLAAEESSGASLGVIDVGTDTVAEIANRPAEHLAFGPGPVLYGSRGTASPIAAGLQTISAEGVASDLPGTLNLGARAFVVRSNDDIVFLGRFTSILGDDLNGVLLYSAADDSVQLGVAYSAADTADGGDMAISADRSTIFVAIAGRNEIVTVSDK